MDSKRVGTSASGTRGSGSTSSTAIPQSTATATTTAGGGGRTSIKATIELVCRALHWHGIHEVMT
jgi:hypothetical protein